MDIHATPIDRATLLPHLHLGQENHPGWPSVLFGTTARAGTSVDASLAVFHLKRFLLCSGRLDAARYVRDRARLAWCDLDHYVLYLPLQRGLAGGNGLRVRVQDVVVLDLAQPAAFGMAAGEGLSLVIPRVVVPHAKGQLHGLRLCRQSTMGGLLGRLLASLAVAAPRLTEDDCTRLTEPLLHVIAACLASAVTDPALVVPDAETLGRRARRYIEGNLQRDDLTPAVVAKALGTSRSQLYRAFEPFGGVARYLLQRRLRRCLLALGEPANAGRRIGDLAYVYGFTDEGHFSKAFRKAFGLSPRAARRALQRGELSASYAAASGAHAPPSLARWLHELAGQ